MSHLGQLEVPRERICHCERTLRRKVLSVLYYVEMQPFIPRMHRKKRMEGLAYHLA